MENISDGEEVVAALMGSLKGDLAAYPDTVRAQVLFYIAQAHYRAAMRRLNKQRLVLKIRPRLSPSAC